MEDGRWTMDDGRWTMDDGRWTMDDGRWTMDDGRWTIGPYRPSSIVHRPLSTGRKLTTQSAQDHLTPLRHFGMYLHAGTLEPLSKVSIALRRADHVGRCCV